jgi:hypothetical protein
MRASLSLSAYLLAAVFSGTAFAETVYISTPTRLQSFSSSNPGTLFVDVPVTGLAEAETLEGIDFRPATGELYGLGSTGQLYRIDRVTGAATAVGTPVPIAGTRYGMDFNPTVDRIRIVSNTGANVRRHPDTGALAATDTDLAFAAGDVNAGDLPGVSAAAYTNSISGATSTVLFDIESGNAVLARQDPPNNGVLNTVGALDFPETDGFAGFDISSRTGLGWAAFNSGGGTRLFEVDLGNGRATNRGLIVGNPQVTGLTVALQEGDCLPTTTRLCLLGDRFGVTGSYETPAGASGSAQVFQLSNESGYLTFFSAGNLEAVVKIIDGCSFNGYYWVYASGLTNLEVVIEVRDYVTEESFPIFNPQGAFFDTVASIEALPCELP